MDRVVGALLVVRLGIQECRSTRLSGCQPWTPRDLRRSFSDLARPSASAASALPARGARRTVRRGSGRFRGSLSRVGRGDSRRVTLPFVRGLLTPTGRPLPAYVRALPIRAGALLAPRVKSPPDGFQRAPMAMKSRLGAKEGPGRSALTFRDSPRPVRHGASSAGGNSRARCRLALPPG